MCIWRSQKYKFLHDRWIFFVFSCLLRIPMMHNSMDDKENIFQVRKVARRKVKEEFLHQKVLESSGYMIVPLFELFWSVQSMKFMWKRRPFCWNLFLLKMQFFPSLPLRTMRNRWWSLVMVQDEREQRMELSAGNGQKRIQIACCNNAKKDRTERFWKRLRQWHNPERSSRKFCHKL